MQNVRRNIAYALVGVWGASILLILVLMIFKLVDLSEGQEILKTFSSVTSGFVGMILGFYFTREDAQQGGADQPATAPESKPESNEKA